MFKYELCDSLASKQFHCGCILIDLKSLAQIVPALGTFVSSENWEPIRIGYEQPFPQNPSIHGLFKALSAPGVRVNFFSIAAIKNADESNSPAFLFSKLHRQRAVSEPTSSMRPLAWLPPAPQRAPPLLPEALPSAQPSSVPPAHSTPQARCQTTAQSTAPQC